MEKKEKKEIEIISGDVEDLNISPVTDNLDIQKPEEDSNKKKNIFIPKVKK